MKNRKHLIRKRALVGWVTAVPLFVILLVVIILRHDQDGEGISRALAVKSVVMALQSPEELSRWQETYKASHFPAKFLEDGMSLIWTICMKTVFCQRRRPLPPRRQPRGS